MEKDLEYYKVMFANRGALAQEELKDIQEAAQFVINYAEELQKALREIDTHIRSDKEPVPYIVETLKATLPEYEMSE